MGVGSRQRWLFAALLAQGGEFAFVVFGVAQTAGVLSADAAGQLTIAVALSMAATPLMLLLHDKLAAWRAGASERPDDEIKESGNPVIIAGFGRFGQIVGPAAVRERHARHRARSRPRAGRAPAQVRLQGVLRRRDAARPAARRGRGARRACWSTRSTTSPTASRSPTACASTFPNLPIIARARNVTHYVELRTRGVTIVERETFESALRTGRHVLEALGVDRFRAREIADAFRRHNIATHGRAGPALPRRSEGALRGEGGARGAARVLRPRPRAVRDGAAQGLEGRILNDEERSNGNATRRTSTGRAAIRISCRTATAGGT